MQGQGGEAALTIGFLRRRSRAGGALVSALRGVTVVLGVIAGALTAAAIVLGITDIRYLWLIGVLMLYTALGAAALRIAGDAIATRPYRHRDLEAEKRGWAPSPSYRRFVPADARDEAHEPVSDLERVDG